MEFQSTRPRGARRYFSPQTPAAGSFNPRAREGRDTLALTVPSDTHVSIHAPARGATTCAKGRRTNALSFNPRAREGRDTPPPVLCGIFGVSIHAPARGATAPFRAALNGRKFQSTRPRGARRHRY